MKTNKKQLVLAVVASLSILLPNFAGAAGNKAAPLKTDAEKLSYTFGRNIGNSLKQAETDIVLDALSRGIDDSLHDKASQVPEEEMTRLSQEFNQKRMANQAAKIKESSEKNQKEGAAFLEQNKKKEGVKVTASGLQYRVEKKGEGPTPKETDTVKVDYRGTLLDGTEFDSSYKRGEPAVFPLNGVIKGWTEALQLMTVGSKYQLVIPAELAYGERGAGGMIGPNATLLFDVELLSIESTEAKK